MTERKLSVSVHMVNEYRESLSETDLQNHEKLIHDIIRFEYRTHLDFKYEACLVLIMCN